MFIPQMAVFTNTLISSNVVQNTVFNAMWFNCIWLLAVMGKYALLPVTVALLLLHIWMTGSVSRELKIIGAIGGIGIAVDSVFTTTGFFIFENHQWLPLWLLALWAGFATTVPRSIYFLRNKPLLAALTGAFGGTTSYLAGHKVGAVQLSLPLTHSILILSLVWAVLLPLFLLVAMKILEDRHAPA